SKLMNAFGPANAVFEAGTSWVLKPAFATFLSFGHPIRVRTFPLRKQPLHASTLSMPQPQVDSAEQDLIRRVQAGDKEAFQCLVRPYERAVFYAAKSVLGNDADAEEAAQEAVLKAFTHIKDFRGQSKFSSWLIRITI